MYFKPEGKKIIRARQSTVVCIHHSIICTQARILLQKNQIVVSGHYPLHHDSHLAR
jgi:hypothetical protein